MLQRRLNRDRDIGYTTNNLTLSGREIYVPVVEQPEEAPENGESTVEEGENGTAGEESTSSD